ncbi:MAG: hypothetical protein HQK96_04190 [Nitrospirae bacterium]|nr:hypothetical protein [Nitrospirota bacterium]
MNNRLVDKNMMTPGNQDYIKQTDELIVAHEQSSKPLYEILCPLPNQDVLIYDLKIYKDYFIILCLDNKGWKVFKLEDFTDADKRKITKQYFKDRTLIGYNNSKVNDIMLEYLFTAFIQPDVVYKYYRYVITTCQISYINNSNALLKSIVPWSRSIDLAKVASLKTPIPLKAMAIRLKYLKIQDIPNPPDDIIATEEEVKSALADCKRNILITKSLWSKYQHNVKLRLQLNDLFNVDVLNMTESEIAEEIMLSTYKQRTCIGEKPKPDTSVKLIEVKNLISSRVNFKTPYLNRFLNKLNSIISDSNNIEDELHKQLHIGNIEFNFTGGGLRTKDGNLILSSTDTMQLVDIDIISCYPSTILNENLCPSHLSHVWLDIYREIVEKRIRAKKAGDIVTAEAIKVVINSIYGRTKFPYSFMYDEIVMYSIVVTVELFLLMLIERLNQYHIRVVSANTDGVLIYIDKQKLSDLDEIIKEWQEVTHYETERAIYTKYLRKDINNFILVSENGEIKRRGVFNIYNFKNKCEAIIIKEAAMEYLLNGISVVDTIRNEKDIYKFIYYVNPELNKEQNLNMVYNGKQIQKTNRWYKSKHGGTLEHSDKNGKFKTDSNNNGVTLINDIENTSIPSDIDYRHYIAEAKRLVEAIEVNNGTRALRLN